jgi:ORF19
MNKQQLIERMESYKNLFGNKAEYIEIDAAINLIEQLDEPQPIKLKDVIARIEKFDLGTKAVWINEILNKLGSEYGTLKYKAGYEQGKVEGEWIRQQLKDADKIWQELNKPTIPRFIVDWIVQAKEDGYNIAGAINEAPKGEVDDWLELDNVDIFAEAWVNGYHIEKEKRYLVKIKGAEEGYNYLNHRISSDSWFFSGESETLDFRVKHTRKELKAGGFCEVFNSPLFEVEEVEE